MISTEDEVEAWFADKRHPQEPAMRRIREIILSADPRMTERVQYGTLHFIHKSDLASFVQLDKPQVTLMFNVGARIPGNFPRLEGSGPNARFMHLADLADVEAAADELRAIAVAWCEYKSPASKKPR